MPRTFPLELVHQVIDELGGEYRENTLLARGSAYEALRACTLVSKRWTAHSRTHLFKEVEIRADEYKPTIPPPTSVSPCIKDLRIFYGRQLTQTPIADLLKAFVAAPIEYLAITGVEFFDGRAPTQEFIEAHSATLKTLELQGWSLSASDVVAILLGRHHLKRLLLVDCQCENLSRPGQSLVVNAPDPNTSSKVVGMELSITGGDPSEGPTSVITMIAQLPHRFSRLDIDHVIGGDGANEATNALIEANADVLSSLQVHFIAGMSRLSNGKVTLLIVTRPRRGLGVGYRRRARTPVQSEGLFQPVRIDLRYGPFGYMCRSGLHLHPLDPQPRTDESPWKDRVEKQLR